MAKKKADNEIAMNWDQYWSWFGSQIITDAERKETFRYFLLAEPLTGMPESAQVEVLEYAPDYIIRYLVTHGVINQEFVDKMHADSGDVSATIKSISFKELCTSLASRRR